ncbi:helix-turn-helix domain-containing protein [Streptomyces koyangensis]|uniref:helix-turn-helix domain-containing protein n=1 Tax=Streptomyces sp. Iso 434 TaxID=3062272 RepID=UPI003981622E
MAPRTQSWKDLPPECPDEKRLLATCLRRVKDCTDLTQQRLAAKCGIVTSTLNGYLNARNQPTPEMLRRFYLAVKEDTDQRGVQLPHSLHELESMLSGQTEKARTASQRPAVRIFNRSHGAKFARRRRSRANNRARVPVPPQRGDRHTRTATGPGWTGLETLLDRLLRHQTQDAFFLIWQSAMTLPASEIPDVVASCRAAGLSDAADAVITNAARRDLSAVLRIAACFHEAHQYEDATLLLNFATVETKAAQSS